MNWENLCIWLIATSYCCFAANVPNNPNSYTLTVDVLSSILSFTACVTLQAFLVRQPQQSILGGICIQFLVVIEVGIIQIITLSLLTNIAHESLNSFYSNYPEIAKYVMNNIPVGCCICGYLLTLSAARFVLIASPDYYQSINQKMCLKLSATFIIVIIILDLMLNHVRCLVTHSPNYSTMSILHTRIEFGILNQSMSNSSWNSLPEELECFEFLIPTAILIVSSLLEVIKVVIYTVRLFRRLKYAARSTKTPATKVVIQQEVVENSVDIKFQTNLFKTSLTEDDTDIECRLSCIQEKPVKNSTNIKTCANYCNIQETSSTKDERFEEIKKPKLSLKRATEENSMDYVFQTHLTDIQKTPLTDRFIRLANNHLYCEQETTVESLADVQTQSKLSYMQGTSLPTERVIKTTKGGLFLQEVTVIRSTDNELQIKLSKIQKTP